METKRNVKELKEVLVLALKLAEAIKKSNEDGEINTLDLPNFLAVIPHLQPALEGITEIPAEVKDIDVDESEELLTLVAGELSVVVEAPKLVAQINAGLKLLRAAKEFYETVK